MKKSLTILLILLAFKGFAQEKNFPSFSASDSLNVYGEWQSKTYEVKKGELITVSFRFLVRKTFMMTCLYSAEIRNDSDKSIKIFFLAGNSGTNYYKGQIGVVKQKINLSPNESMVVDYRLPTKTNSKDDTDDIICRKCKELDHAFTFVK